MAERIPLRRDVTRLKVVHRQRVLRYGDASPAPPLDRDAMPAALVRSASGRWQSLLETEHESVVIGSWMASALARLGAPLDILGAFGRVVEDEIRHVDVCAQMVEMFGAEPSVPRIAQPPFPLAPEGDAGRAAEFEVVAGLVGFFCVFEHLSAHVFRAALEAAEDATAKWALSEIHRDEAFHGAFGFETAKVFLPSWSDAERARLGQRIEGEIVRFERKLGGPLPAAPPRAARIGADAEARALEKLGLLGAPDLLSIFYAAVEQELLPRLAELRVPVEVRIATRGG